MFVSFIFLDTNNFKMSISQLQVASNAVACCNNELSKYTMMMIVIEGKQM